MKMTISISFLNFSKKKWITFSIYFGIILVFLSPLGHSEERTIRGAVVETKDEEPSSDTEKEQAHHRQLQHSRAYPSWKASHPDESWCVHRKPNINRPKGLIFVKNYKTGSSTVSGLTKRMARLHGTADMPCEAYWRHNPGWEYRNRESPSFLFSSVRHPTNRAVSHVFFEFVSRLGGEASDTFVLDRLDFVTEPFPVKWAIGKEGSWKKQKWASFQLSYMSMRDPEYLFIDPATFKDPVKDGKAWENEIVKEIINDYDLIMISERMNESLVAMQLLLGLETGDLLYLKSKVGGSQWLLDNQVGKCVELKKSKLSDKVKAYINSPEWEERITGDLSLYTAANRSLDATIAKLGRKKFKKALDEYIKVLKHAQDVCGPSAVWPCDENGNYQEDFEQDCEAGDQGCGLRCLDKLAQSGVFTELF